MCPALYPMHVVQRRDVPATSPHPPGAAALLPGKDGLSHRRMLYPMLSPQAPQDCHQSTPSHCIPSPWHVAQQLMSLSASPAIHETWHGTEWQAWHVSLHSPGAVPKLGSLPGSACPCSRTPVMGDASWCPQGPSAQITDNVVERWKEYSEECQRNMSRLPAPTGQCLWGLQGGFCWRGVGTESC